LKLSRESVIPLYYQIKEDITARIERGEWKLGDRIPSEIELSAYYDVSRGTARQSLLELVNEGILIRRKGKGTFVAKRRESFDLQNIFSFTELVRRKGSIPGARVISVEIYPGDPIINPRLGLNPDEKVVKIVRLRLADNEPMEFEENFVVHHFVPDIVNLDLDDVSLYHLLLEQYSIRIVRSRTILEPVITNKEQAKYLKVKEGSPALLVDTTYFTRDDTPVLLGQGIMRGDRCRYFVEFENTVLQVKSKGV
jgi:GntR family transcriptional regulator